MSHSIAIFFSLLASIAHNYYFCYFFYRCFVLLLSSPPCLWLHQCREYEIKNNKTASTVWAVAAQAEWSAQSLNSNETISYICIAHTYFARIKCVSVLLLLLLFKSLANKQRFSILALFLFDRHLEFCLFVLSLDSLNSIVCLIILALTRVRLLTHSIARFTSLWRWRQQIQPNRTSLCLHWLNFLLCIAIATTQKRDRFISCTNVYERFLWNYRWFWYYHLNNRKKRAKIIEILNVRSSHVFNFRGVRVSQSVCGCVFHWHIDMFDLRFCFWKERSRKKTIINLRTDWLTGKVSLLQNKSEVEKKRNCFAKGKKRHWMVYYKFTHFTNICWLVRQCALYNGKTVIGKKMCDVDSFTHESTNYKLEKLLDFAENRVCFGFRFFFFLHFRLSFYSKITKKLRRHTRNKLDSKSTMKTTKKN